MSEKPILFTADMVKAILDGRKTQTRRVIKPQPPEQMEPKDIHVSMYSPVRIDKNGIEEPGDPIFGVYDDYGEWGVKCPYGIPGHRLWVRETFAIDHVVVYKADDPIVQPKRWKPSIFMPRWASRINLLVKDIRVEQVQEISNEEALAEGCGSSMSLPYKREPRWIFMDLWNSINKKRGHGWKKNPWVWVVEFELMED